MNEIYQYLFHFHLTLLSYFTEIKLEQNLQPGLSAFSSPLLFSSPLYIKGDAREI